MRRLALSALAALALTSTVARAQGASQPMAAGTDNLSGWLLVAPGSPAGVGLGARFMIPIVPEGLLRGQGIRIREELALEVGADYLHWGYHQSWGPYGNIDWDVNALEIVAGGMWNWWVTPKVALYPKLDVGYRIAWLSGWDNTLWGTPGSYSELFINGAVGAIFKLQKVSFRIEAGNHALRLGLGVKL
jgi:hypothetical protein